MININFTVAGVVAILAAITSLVFEFLPKVKGWFEAKTAEQKRQINAVALFVIVAVVFAGGCFQLFSADNLFCDVQGVIDAVVLYLQAIAVNQGVHKLFKKD